MAVFHLLQLTPSSSRPQAPCQTDSTDVNSLPVCKTGWIQSGGTPTINTGNNISVPLCPASGVVKHTYIMPYIIQFAVLSHQFGSRTARKPNV